MSNMKLHILQRQGKYIGDVELLKDSTLNDLKTVFYTKFHYYPERQRFTTETGLLLRDGGLIENGINDGSIIYFKDLGVQISWRLVFVLEYLGPLIIMPLFWYFPNLLYSKEDLIFLKPKNLTQLVGFLLFNLHFVKRELEALFVHRFSSATMPFIRLPINCTHYWFFCAFAISYFLCHPRYQAPFDNSPLYVYALGFCFIVFEILNFRTHYILRQLRPRGTKQRGLPTGCGFQWVSCANYMWELASWITYSCLIMCFTSFMFTIIAMVQMSLWALKKHANYQKEFYDDKRPKYAIIPYIL